MRRLEKIHPDTLDPHLAEIRDSALRRAVLDRNQELTRVLMQLGADARVGIWPHRDVTSAYAIAVDREYREIVAIIEREEETRHARVNEGSAPTSTAVDVLRHAIAEDRDADAIALMEAEAALIRACDVNGITPLHLAAWKHNAALVAWLLDHGASPGAVATAPSLVASTGQNAAKHRSTSRPSSPAGRPRDAIPFSISWKTPTSIRHGFTRRPAC